VDVRRRILSSIVAVTALAVGLLSVPLAIAAARLYRSQEITRLQANATRAADALPASGLTGEPIDLPRTGRHTDVALYDATSRLVVGRGPAHGGPAVHGALTGRVTQTREPGDLVVAIPLTEDKAVIGAARAAVRTSVVDGRTRRSWLAMALLGAVAVLVAWAVARRQARRIAMPVDELGAALARLGDGDFSVRTARHGIPELDLAGAALDATAERLGDVLARERAFSADASHQLSTSLTGLRLTLEGAMVTPGTDLTSTIVEALGEVDRLHATLRELLALARDTERPAVAIDIGAALTQSEPTWRRWLADRGRRLVVEPEAGLHQVRCSWAAIRQVLDVLVDNAARHGEGTVTVRARAAGDGVIVEVEDEGPGIAGDPEAIFRRRSGSGDGHGIGLALARRLSEADGARLVLHRAGPQPVFALVFAGVRPGTGLRTGLGTGAWRGLAEVRGPT
jgi:signal transduction histidine kinase